MLSPQVPDSSPHPLQLLVRREAAELLLREHQSAVDGDFEGAAAALHERDVGAGGAAEDVPRTEGTRLIVSLHAIFDGDVHNSSPVVVRL